LEPQLGADSLGVLVVIAVAEIAVVLGVLAGDAQGGALAQRQVDAPEAFTAL
jgi:hypothetical protein